MEENELLSKAILICYDPKNKDDELLYIIQNFCGKVFLNPNVNQTQGSIYYLCGDIHAMKPLPDNYVIITPYSYNYKNDERLTHTGKVPINICNAGVFFREFFDKSYYDDIVSNHQFQSLTESNKQGNAYRKGIYITHVSDKEDGRHFNLLRCSTNFSGPTNNLKTPDLDILQKLNDISKHIFKDTTIKLNHVLAQIYHNVVIESENGKRKDRKARIKEHSDKTKDIPRNGLIAFNTFYKEMPETKGVKPTQIGFDRLYKKTSIYTRLKFKAKDPSMCDFTIPLYPNSVFIISLKANRLYTHEIVPPSLSVQLIPVRMGYVARCSNAPAVHYMGKTYLLKNNEKVELERETPEKIKQLRNMYKKENVTTDIIEYDELNFSMNEGDYTKPLL